MDDYTEKELIDAAITDEFTGGYNRFFSRNTIA